MAIDFPNSPSTNDTHTVGDKTWVYADGKWSTSTGVSTTNASLLTSGTLNNARLPAVATTITTVGTLGSLAVTNGVTAATFTGALTGNASTATNVAYTGLTGTVPTWNQNTTGTAATVTGAAQTAITSVGTLSSLAVTNGVTAATFTGALTGNASTATNVAYTGLTGTVPTWNQNTTGTAATVTGASQTAITALGELTTILVGKTTSTTTVAAANDTGSFSVRGSTTHPAVMSFHRSNAYAVNFGLSTANKMELGGWSASTIKHTWDMSGNYDAVGGITASYIKLSASANDSTTHWGYTAYGSLRTFCGYGVGVAWISSGGTSQLGGFTPNAHATFMAGSTISGDIRSPATNTTQYTTSSDYRLKENITEISDAIERIRRLRPVSFQFKDTNNDIFYDGFLAHEVQEVIPYAVGGVKDAVTADGEIMPQMIDMSTMVGLLTAGIKELDARLAQLETI